jgi:hypothetical protein
MKTIKSVRAILMLIVLAGTLGCKKENPAYSKNLESFKFVIADGNGVEKEYPGTINGDQITVVLPTEADVTNLKAVFTTDNPRTIVQIGTAVQESGVSVQDFTAPVKYIVKAEDKSTQQYMVSIDKKVGIKAFGFFKADNPALKKDYIGVVRGLAIEVGLPESVALSSLIARYETSIGAVIKVGADIQESKITANNFTSTVVYSLTDPTVTVPINYSVTTYILGTQWELIADNLTDGVTAAALRMAISPITGYPYFIYQRTGKDEDGATLINDKKTVAVVGYNGTKWQYIGAQKGASEFRADLPGIAFDKDGVVYISYRDYLNNAQTATVMKFVNNEWIPVGPKRFTPVKPDYLSFALTPNDVPMLSMAKNGSDASGVPARGLYVTNYINGSWTNVTPPGGIIIFYDQLIRGLDGKMYIGVMDRSTGANKPSLYKYDNGVWNAVGPTSFTAPDNIVGAQAVSIAVDKDGQAYLAYQVAPSSGRLNHVMKYDKASNTWKELGSPVLTGGTSDNIDLEVDADGKLYFAYANASSLIVKTFNTETNNWNTERKAINEKIYNVGSYGFDMQIAPNGTVYVVANILSNSKTQVYRLEK